LHLTQTPSTALRAGAMALKESCCSRRPMRKGSRRDRRAACTSEGSGTVLSDAVKIARERVHDLWNCAPAMSLARLEQIAGEEHRTRIARRGVRLVHRGLRRRGISRRRGSYWNKAARPAPVCRTALPSQRLSSIPASRRALCGGKTRCAAAPRTYANDCTRVGSALRWHTPGRARAAMTKAQD